MSKLAEAGWNIDPEDMDNYATLFSCTYSAGDGGDFLWNYGRIIINITPIMSSGKVLSPQLLEDYIQDLLVDSSLVNTI